MTLPVSAMQDRETQFLDALYLGVRDRAGFDQALDLLCALFDVPSAALLDFDAARPDVSALAFTGVFSGEAVERYERDFAAIDPAPPAFMKRPAGTAISTTRMLPDEYRKPGAFFCEFFRPLGSKNVSAARSHRATAISPWWVCTAPPTGRPSMMTTSPGSKR